MTMPSRLPVSLACALALAGIACDDARGPTTAPPPAEPGVGGLESAPPVEPPARPEPPPEAKAAPKPAPPPGPSCDRRGSSATGVAASTCVDYGRYDGGAWEPRCTEDTELAEAGCPREQLAAHCLLPVSGVRLFYYEGVELDAARRECATLEGEFGTGAITNDAPSP